MVKEVLLPLLRRFGVGADAESSAGLDVSVKRRGAPPLGGGLVEFRCPPVRQLKAVRVRARSSGAASSVGVFGCSGVWVCV